MESRQILKYALPIVLFITILSSCTSPKDTNYLQQNKKPSYSVKPFDDYQLQNNDEIYCTILTSDKEFSEAFNQVLTSSEAGGGNSNSNSSTRSYYTIFENGNISIPYFGDIKIEGMTIPQAEIAIQRKMQTSIPDAQVKVILRNNIFYVVDNQRGGSYQIYKENLSIYQALALSGDVNPSLDLSKVKIIRKNKDGSSIVKTFDLRTESIIESEFYYIKPNDVIYYSTSNRSFFRVNSFTSLITTVIAPITFLVATLSIKL